MATITHLPDDVIVIILEIEGIRVEDIMNFKSTCKRFQKMILSQKFWQKKYYQSSSIAEKKYNREKQKKIFYHIDFEEKIKAGLYCIQKLKYYAFLMSENKVRDTDKEQLECLLRSIAENSMTYYFVWDEINRICAEKSCKLIFNLTREYYFKLTFYYLKQYRFIYKQMKLIKMPKRKLLLEKQLTIVAQYFQPHVSYSIVKMWLNSITETVLSRLKNKYPAHSICSTRLEQFSFWRDNNIDDNFWNEKESRQIMSILEEYIFSELEIHNLHQLLMIPDLETKHMKYIAGRFRTYLLTVTYEIVARRLGIYNILKLNGIDIEVIWKPNYHRLYSLIIDIDNNTECFYMSCKSNLLYPSNIIRERDICLYYRYVFMMSSDYILLTREMMKKFNYELEYSYNIHKKWTFNIFSDFLYQCVKNVKDINIENEYKNITNTIEVRSNAVKEPLKWRTKNMKFAVGMIVTHTWKPYSFPNNHDGVIIGWHRNCDRTFRDKLNKTNMLPYLRTCFNLYHICECQQSSASAHQLHYIILTENNRICYVQQDQLSICPPKEIDNIEIGKYFSSFEGTYYVPNKSLKKHYPKDTAAIAKILAKQ